MGIYIAEDFVNATEGYRYSDSGTPYDTDEEKIGRLYKHLTKEYGRCMSKEYVGDGTHVGWVFEKSVEYDDSGRYGRKREWYIRETWVTLFLKVDEKIVRAKIVGRGKVVPL